MNCRDDYPHAIFAACTLLMALLFAASALWSAAFASPPQAEEIALRYDLDPSLLKAVCAIESNWQPKAIGDDGKSIGLCQMQPATALRLYPKDWKKNLTYAQRLAEIRRLLFDPTTNMVLTASYLQSLLSKYDGDVTLALLAYNAGENFVDARFECKGPHTKTALCYAGKVKRKMK